jgi:hypothetical protein
MLHQTYNYAETLAAQERITWRVEDLIGPDKPFDFGKAFLPESLARVRALDFLSPVEQRVLNQIRGHGYLYMFGLVEEFILPFVLDHARPMLSQDDVRTRALLRFAMEEAKHIHLFRTFEREFEAGFGMRCEMIGPANHVAGAVLAHHPLSVALLILQVEWMTQRHYLDSIRDNNGLDEQFKSLLRHHWMEEAQHAQLDTLMVESIAAGCTAADIEKAVDGYLEIGALFDGAFKQQAAFDLDALQVKTGLQLTAAQCETVVAVQHQAMRWTYLGSGISHPNFLRSVRKLSPAQADRLAEVAVAFS